MEVWMDCIPWTRGTMEKGYLLLIYTDIHKTREEVSIVSDGKVEWMRSWTQIVLDSRANYSAQASEDMIWVDNYCFKKIKLRVVSCRNFPKGGESSGRKSQNIRPLTRISFNTWANTGKCERSFVGVTTNG